MINKKKNFKENYKVHPISEIITWSRVGERVHWELRKVAAKYIRKSKRHRDGVFVFEGSYSPRAGTRHSASHMYHTLAL